MKKKQTTECTLTEWRNKKRN